MATRTPLVSIVTPCLNPSQQHLERCLRSIRDQTYPSVEHVVVDGGSDGPTIRQLERSGVRFISEPDEGQSEAITKGFALAGGAIVGWVNTDDELLPDTISLSVQGMNEHRVQWTYGLVQLHRGDEIFQWYRPSRRIERTGFFGGNPIPQPGSLWARSLQEQAGSLDAGLHYAMDLDLWIRFVELGARPLRIDAPLARFEVHEGSKSGAVPNARFVQDMAQAFRRHGWLEHAAAAAGRSSVLAGGDPGLQSTLTAELTASPRLRSAFTSAAAAERLIAASRDLPSSFPALARLAASALGHVAGRQRLQMAARAAAARVEARLRRGFD